MTLLLVTQREKLDNLILFHLTPIGFHVHSFNNPIKAMSRLGGMRPDLVLFDARDFKRAWKPFLVLLRHSRSKKETVFILVIDQKFQLEEMTKATHLQINGLLDPDVSTKMLLENIKDIYRRYKSLKEKRKFKRIIPNEYDRLNLIFTHPVRFNIIHGCITDISLQGAAVKPDNALATAGLERGQKIPHCSLRVGEVILSINCVLVRNREELGLQFESLTEEHRQILSQYVKERAQRELSGTASV